MKNKVLYVLFLILILPFFVLLTLSLRDKGSEESLLNSFYSYAVEKTDGVIDPDGVDFSFVLTGDEKVVLNYSWDVKDPGYITGFSITDSSGDSVFCTSGFQLSQDGASLNLEKGEYYGRIEFFCDEDSFRDFCESNNMFDSDEALDDYIDMIGFDTFDEESFSVCEISIEITGYTSASAPALMKVLAVILGFLELGILVLLLIFEKTEDDGIKNRMNNIALRYAVFALAVTLVQVVFAYLIRYIFADASAEIRSNLSFFLVILSVDIVGFPLILLTCRKIPVNRIEKRNIGFGMYLVYALMTLGLIFVGAIIGYVIHMILAPSTDTSSLADLMYNSSPLPRILTVGIFAPVFEELIFRKVLIDRLNKYGALISVLVSGLFFGLFHGNFQQFFFAAFVGCLWAVLYLKTGKIHLTIGLHMMINMGTSAITLFLVTHTMDGALLTGEITDDMVFQLLTDPYFIALMLWVMFIMLAGVAGLVIFIVFASTGKLKVTGNEAPAPAYPYGVPMQQAPEFTQAPVPEAKPSVNPVAAFFGAKYTWAFILICVGLFIMSYI